ncbi:MAG: hypothetical protein ABNO50_00460 [Candidatus Shikimatogenerans sp. Tduv]|uniref:Uncharacterized protein n=1 Tax=Candidatus Shikimatogenerans sp. Tduv TaxID=3158567 RepID=A0AAU7QR69_9FLAO
MVKKKIKEFVLKLKNKKIIYFLNIKKIKSIYLAKIRKIFYKNNIIMKNIKNSIYIKYINNIKLLNNNIIKKNLTILIYNNKLFDKEKNLNIPINIINNFIKKYNLFPIKIKSIYINKKIYYKKLDIELIKKSYSKNILILKMNKIFMRYIYIFLYSINYYIFNIITLLLFLKNVKKN